ncbi:MAG: sodium-dependent phosphate transporter [Firmicutes bacterium HGW-Firmicutes-11]|nr:MAG: sodium-dependent phosphate transporter [Firmicutes bacterium HGW-Firmicutes-11]
MEEKCKQIASGSDALFWRIFMTGAMVVTLLGGLGMFLYGMKMMSDGLEAVAGDRMRRTLEILTTNRLAAVGVGAGITAVVQSSSATTVMVVGFVNAGLMSLAQATGVIMGANIGTTVTAQLIAFKLTDIAPAIVFIGMILVVFLRKKKLNRIGYVVLGFGLLFVGLATMSHAMEPLRDVPEFREFLINFNNPLVGILVGTVFTVIVQSSSASVGILQSFAMLGLIDLDSAIFVILGQNIGTCFTAVFAAIGTGPNSKRTAGIHLLFNIIGSIVFLVIVLLAPGISDLVESFSPNDVTRQIANFHTIFNITVTILLFPFANYLVRLVTRLIPDVPTIEDAELKLVYLDERIAQTPAIALNMALKEVNRMGVIACNNMQRALDSFFGQDAKKAAEVVDVEKTIDFLCDSITDYLVQFRGLDLSDEDLRVLGTLHHVVIDLERIGDLAENIMEYGESIEDKRTKFSPEAYEEMRIMGDKTMETLLTGLDVFEKRDKSRVYQVAALEQEVDDLKQAYIQNHIDRLMVKACDPQAGVIFTNLITTLERITDHTNNITQTLTEID